jgi:hypothetical protein
MIPTRSDVNPSFDDPESFVLNIKTGIIRANIGDISNFINALMRAEVRTSHSRKLGYPATENQ